MMPDYAVKMTFKGVDDTSKIFAAMERAAAKYGGTAKESMRGVGRAADHASTALRNATKHGYNFGAIIKGVLAANAIRGGIGYITGGIVKTASDYLHFGDVMTGAVARFREVDTRSSAFGDTVETMGKQVRRSMLSTRYSALEGAQALNVLSMAGYSSGAALQMLPNLAGLATAAGEDFNEAVLSSSKILGGFGGRSDDVQVQVKNHIKLNDQLAESFLLATGDMHGMLETMKVIAPLSKEIHATQSETLALGVALSNAGIDGTDAATAIKRGFLNMFMTSQNMQKEFNMNGVFPYDLKTGQPRKYITVLGEVKKALDKLTPAQRNPILRDIFGVYGLAGQLKLMHEMGKIADYENRINKSTGVIDSISSAANSSPFAKLVMLGNTALEKGFQVLDQYAGKAKGGFEWLAKKIENFDVRPLISALDLTGQTLWKMFKIAEPFMPMLPTLVEGFVAWKVALEAIAIGKGIWGMMKIAKLGFDIAASLSAGLGPLGAMKTAVQALGGAIATAIAPLVAAAPIWATIAALLAAAGYTSNAMKENGWGDNRTTEQLLADRNGAPGPYRDEHSAIAPNVKDARAKGFTFSGQLNIGGIPAGSSYNGQPIPGGSLPLLMNMGDNK